MGKTALAMKFAHKHNSFFESGVYALSCDASSDLLGTVNSVVPITDKSCLLILDEVEARSLASLQDEIFEIKIGRPKLSVLLLSRLNSQALPADFTLRLNGLPEYDIRSLLEQCSAAGLSSAVVAKMSGLSKGNPLVVNLLAMLLRSNTRTISDVIDCLSPFTKSTILGPDGYPLERDGSAERQIIVDLNAVNVEALWRIRRDPQLVFDLSSREFEEFIAEILSRLGYEVSLTPASKDGGKDLCVARKGGVGTFMYLVECKKYSPANPVKVNLVRQLSGVVQAERATAGILVTTSSFTRGARALEKQLSHQISLKDYIDVQDWLNRALKR